MGLLSRLRNMVQPDRLRSDLDDEFAFHVEMRTKENIAKGMTPAEAARQARRSFGNAGVQRDNARDASILPSLESLLQDLRYALRAIGSSRGVAVLVVAALALGIGANASIFTIANALLLRDLPVGEPERLVHVDIGNSISYGWIEVNDSFSFRLWQDFAQRQGTLREIFAYGEARVEGRAKGESRELIGAFVSPSAFSVLRVRPVLGRAFEDVREVAAGQRPEAVISYSLWQREYLSDPAAIGQRLIVEGKPFEIAGVLPQSFRGLNVGRSTDVYFPLSAERFIFGTSRTLTEDCYWLHVFARLPAASTEQALETSVNTLAPLSMQTTLPNNLPAEERPRYLRQWFRVRPAILGISSARQELQRPLEVLMGIAGALLLLTCVTIASLLLARATARTREIAVRIALGASRGRVTRQLLLESGLLALTGALGGLLLARVGTALLVSAYSTLDNPLSLDLAPDGRVLLFTMSVAVLSALLFGLGPAFRASHVTPAETLKSGTGTGSRGVLRVRRVLLSGQIALATALVFGAILFAGTLHNLLSENAGFRQDRVLLAHVDTSRIRVDNEARRRLHASLLEQLKRIPGVETGSASVMTPITGASWQYSAKAETAAGLLPVHVFYNAVSPAFLETFGTSVLAGRNMTEQDRAGAPPVGIVNIALARAAFGAEPALGRRLHVGDGPEARVVEIVGVVEDAKYRSLRESVPPTLYAPIPQEPVMLPFISFAVRVAGPVASVMPAVRRVLTTGDPALRFKLIPFSAQVSDSVARERAFFVLGTLFGLLAVALASIGLYGVLSYLIAQRQPEIGIRMALGASPADVRRLLYAQSGLLVGAGTMVGLLLASWGASSVRTLLYGIQASDPAVYLIVVGVLALVGAAATVVPAIRASRTDPLRVLRCE